MGIKGIYHEIGPGIRIALSKLAVEHFERRARPLRLAIDISIWLFQIQSGKGGTNPALRTFYYRLLRLTSLSIHPLFVFDGPNKPPFKRNKRTGPNVASIPEFLAKQLLKQFGMPFHQAPGEAEAECALLQRKGIVDAVLSEDVDTLMFGSGMTVRNWSVQDTLKSSKTPTHVNVYHADETKTTSGLDREGMILVAIMSGGDYIPEGIPGCGPKTACEAARAGFGKDLCSLTRADVMGREEFVSRLKHELLTNESKHFSRKHKALVIPEDFPRLDILRYYTHPVISPDEKIEQLRKSLKWDLPFDIPALRTFTMEAFNWVCISGARHFIRNLAPPLLARDLRLRIDQETLDDCDAQAAKEKKLIKGVFGRRNHPTNDDVLETRVGFIPHELVPIDLDAEEPDPETVFPDDMDADADEAIADAAEDPLDGASRRRGPVQYDPFKVEKIWMLDTFVRMGVPLTIEDYEATLIRQAMLREEKNNKASRRAASSKNQRSPRRRKPNGGMTVGALDVFTKVTKLGTKHSTIPEQPKFRKPADLPDMTEGDDVFRTKDFGTRPPQRTGSKIAAQNTRPPKHTVIDLLSSPESNPVPRKRVLRRSQSENAGQETNAQPERSEETHIRRQSIPGFQRSPQSNPVELPPTVTTRRRRSPRKGPESIDENRATSPLPRDPLRPSKDMGNSSPPEKENALQRTPKRPTPKKVAHITISSSPTTPGTGQRSIHDFFSPQSRRVLRDASPSPYRPPPSTISFPASPTRSTRVAVGARLAAATKSVISTSIPSIDLSGDSSPIQIANVDRMSPLPSRIPPQAGSAPIPQAAAAPAEVFRIRESLAGSFAVEAAAPARPAAAAPRAVTGSSSSRTTLKQGAAAKPRALKQGSRVWRISQVEILDMTED